MGPDGDDRSSARRRRIRRACAEISRRAAARRRCGSRRQSWNRSVGANQLANVRWSALFDDVELTAADVARLAKEDAAAHPVGGPVGRNRPGRSQGGGRGAGRAGTDQPALGCRDAAARVGPRRVAARGRLLRRGRWVGRPTCSRPPRRSRPNRRARPTGSSASSAAIRPKRWRGSASSTPSGSADAWRSTWVSARRRRCSRTCSPGIGNGPALVIAPPAVVGNWTAEARPVRTPDCGSSCTTARPRRARRDRGRSRATPTSS